MTIWSRAIKQIYPVLRRARAQHHSEAALCAVVGHIKALSSLPVHLIDANFPRHQAFSLGIAAELGYLDDGGESARFAASFKSGGGAVPLVRIHDGEGGGIRRRAADEAVWLNVDAAGVDARLIKRLEVAQIRLLMWAADWKLHSERLLNGALAGWALFDFAIPGVPDSGYIAAIPEGVLHMEVGLQNAGNRAASRSTLSGDERRRCRVVCAESGLVAAGSVFDATPANRLVTDNVYPIEEIGNVSWLWVGPGPIARFAMGRVPLRASGICIEFASSELHPSLYPGLAFQVNGITVPHGYTARPDGSGSAAISFGSSQNDDCIVGVANKVGRTISETGRTLRACVDTIRFVN